MCYFQQDGAIEHFHIDVVNYTNNEFPRKWAGRGAPIEYPPRSPDLTPIDFYLWGVLKDIVYTMKLETLQELRGEIQNACRNIPVETIQNVCNSVVRRYQKCIDARGGHFEHL